MQSIDQLREKAVRFSDLQDRFYDYARENPAVLEASNYVGLENNDPLHRLQPWPTFISAAVKEEFQRCSVGLFHLLRSLPARIFNNDPQKISDYFEIPIQLARLQLSNVSAVHLDNLLGRGDFLSSPTGLKCIEYNVSASLGGLQVPMWEALVHKTPVLTRFFSRENVGIRNRNMLRVLLEHIISAGGAEAEDTATAVNTLLVAVGVEDNSSNSDLAYLKHLYREVTAHMPGNLHGDIFMCDFKHLEITDGCVFYKGKKIHIMVELNNGIVSPEVLDVFKAGNIRLMNGPITALLSNKLNMALLSDPRYHDSFSASEIQLMEDCVPWSRKLVPGTTSFHGKQVGLAECVLQQREQMVLKPAIGYGGTGVYIGRFTSETQWRRLVDEALKSRNWLVQERCETVTGLYQAGDNGCQLHDLVWGFFVMGDSYAGAWARVMPAENSKGVVNCHQGARISIIFEVDK